MTTYTFDGQRYRLVYLDYATSPYRDPAELPALGVRMDYADADDAEMCRWEFTIESGRPDPNATPYTMLRIPDIAYDAFRDVPELFEMLADSAPCSLAGVRALLDDLGAVELAWPTDPASGVWREYDRLLDHVRGALVVVIHPSGESFWRGFDEYDPARPLAAAVGDYVPDPVVCAVEAGKWQVWAPRHASQDFPPNRLADTVITRLAGVPAPGCRGLIAISLASGELLGDEALDAVLTAGG